MSAEGKGGPWLTKGEFYRQCRLWHGYLSAFSFLALLFFSVTGILLNHPDWPKVRLPDAVQRTIVLSPSELAQLKTSPEPAPAIARLIGGKMQLLGAFKDGEVSGSDVFIRMQGVRGTSDLRGNIRTGKIDVVVEPHHPVALINGLHRAEQAGWPWRIFVDVLAGLLIVMSLIGFILFLSLRFRLRTALILMGASVLVMGGLYVFTVT